MELEILCQKACDCRLFVGKLDTDEKNKVLNYAADLLVNNTDMILQANRTDIENGKAKGLDAGFIDRLTLTGERVLAMANGLREIARLADPIGDVLSMSKRPNGLIIGKRRVALGVVGVIYESRPNVTCDAFGLCFKTGNCVILKGGSDAICSNKAIVKVLKQALLDHNIPENALSLIEDTDRETTLAFMKMKDYVDVLIPRGGQGLIRQVVQNATIPVIETGVGNCHVYVDEFADLDMAVKIVTNAKTQRISVCNACESLLVHEKIAGKFLPMLQLAMLDYKVDYFTDEKCKEKLNDSISNVTLATEEDWGKEYLDYAISVKSVKSIDEAIAHINKYNTSHSETIVTSDYDFAQKFLDEVDAACVYVNASTRFSDGYEFGFGAEIGISTQKLHARGPMGLEALTSYKYIIYGSGQIRE